MEIEEKYDLSKEELSEGYDKEGDDDAAAPEEESYGSEAEGSGEDF